MKHKKIYNNLYESVLVCILLSIMISLYLITLCVGVFSTTENTNSRLLVIVSSCFFGYMIVCLFFVVVRCCFSYWLLTEDSIISKKLFRKRVEIRLKDIERVKIEKIRSPFGGFADAYIFCSKEAHIIIPLLYLQKKPELKELEQLVNAFVNTNITE